MGRKKKGKDGGLEMKNIWKLFIGEEKNQTNMCQFSVNKTQQSSQTILRRTYWAGSVWLQEMTCFAFKPPRLSLLNGDPSCSLPTPFFFYSCTLKEQLYVINGSK